MTAQPPDQDAAGTAPTPAGQTPGPAEPWLQITSSRHLAGWLAQSNASLGFTTYQSGKLFLLGVKPDGQVTVCERTFNRCMGLCGDDQTLWLSSRYQLWRFANVLAPGQNYQGSDRLYVPRAAYTTGDLDIHDIGTEAGGRPVFVATHFNCLATLSYKHSFVPLWRPPFVSALVAEDRCHLNGLAFVDGQCRYVTAVSRSDVVDGWRDHRKDGGVVLRVPDGEVIASGLSMPHSPRWYRDRLWLHNSGRGDFGYVDLDRGVFEPVAFCPGYLRGLAFVGGMAVMGLSQTRSDPTFGGLELGDRLAAKTAAARCSVQVVDLTTGEVAHWARLEGVVRELYDVIALSGTVRPSVLGVKSTEIEQLITIDTPAAL